ncbi:DUF2304 domain-containing protein [Paenibacillus sp. CGMCC 1.16610]|uniref:DUF2304 family protein n=1 Tax=Paenibacillus anseongense TaxID=2682845 RepID=A0ABW9U2T9_9BACL|nr:MULTISPECIES: DUF2304 domain-containing protein [Paenibacillus]MBA2943260.1 DUF2304 domain-containing protein [Paenibacillus sp. CGMCC 1.16610]MVQ33758.1 DUF2304 family protein [Paenibacillus anseongense]
MISFKLQLFLIVFCFICFMMFLNLIIKFKLDLKYSLLWFLLIIITISLAVFPNLAEQVAHFIGIETPVNAIFLFGILLTLIIMFSLTRTLSNHQSKIKEISQELGVLKLEVLELKNQQLKTNYHLNNEKVNENE